MKRYVYVGPRTGEVLSYHGAILWHHDRGEMEFLLPGCRVIELPPGEAGGRPLMRLSEHPSLAAVDWPIRKESFR